MTRPFSFHPEARVELREAVKFYESERQGVGADFVREVRAAVEHILEHPMSGSPAPAGTRRKVLPHFPYLLFYRFEQAEVTIVAVAHQRRRPGYWQPRVSTRESDAAR